MQNIKEVVKDRPSLEETVLQFGGGNFLRAFVDWMIDLSNEKYGYPGGVVIVQPIPTGPAKVLNFQDGLYTVSLRGNTENGKKIENRIIRSVTRGLDPYEDFSSYKELVESDNLKYVVSNTTEAGIVYKKEDLKDGAIQDSFPAKVTQLLYMRYKKFAGDPSKGLVFFPVELIDDNGHKLREYVLKHISDRGLEDGFKKWVENSNHFTSTLVDRIVTGFPGKEEASKFYLENGYEDKLLTYGELFNLWVIEGDKSRAEEFAFDDLSCKVIWTKDVRPYKKRKVRILNGGHTSTVPAAVIAGFDIVRDFMEDEVFANYLNNLIDEEIIPTIDLPEEDLKEFKNQVALRFNNPYVDHKLLSITLNSISKFKARCLPTIIDYYNQSGKAPRHLAFSMAALLRLYKVELIGEKYIGIDQNRREYEIKDDRQYLDFFEKISKEDSYPDLALNSNIWGYDLNELGDFTILVKDFYKKIEEEDIREVIANI